MSSHLQTGRLEALQRFNSDGVGGVLVVQSMSIDHWRCLGVVAQSLIADRIYGLIEERKEGTRRCLFLLWISFHLTSIRSLVYATRSTAFHCYS